ncbi:MAG: amino acid permease [Planctomycetota bacterium]
MSRDPAPAPPQLGAFDIGCIVVGGIIGVGIFFTPAKVAAAVDTPALMIAAWGVGAVLAIIGALVFAGLSRLAPGHGGTFVYIAKGFGPLPAFLYGWANWLVIQAGALAVVGMVMVDYLEQAVFGGPVLGAAARVAVAVVAIAALTLTNAAGLRVGKRVQNALTVAKVGALLVLVAIALAAAAAGVAPVEPPAPREPRGPWVSLGAAMLPVLFSFGGWQQGSFVAGAARRPERDVPLGIVFGVLVVAASYLAVNLAFLSILGHEGAAQSSTIAEEATRRALDAFGIGDVAGRLLSAAVVVSAVGIMNTICLAPPFVLHAMAREGLFFAAVGRLHPIAGVPVLGVLTQGFWGAALLVGAHVALPEPQAALGFVLDGIVFVDWVFYGGCGLALFVLAKERARDRVIGAAFALGAVAVALGAVLTKTAPSAVGLGLCALGLPLYFVLRRRR